MSKVIKLKKGFDINLAGKAANKVAEAPRPDTYAVKPTDFVNVNRPKVLVNEGDTVKVGTPIFYDRKMEKVIFTAPASGEIVEIKRGEKRKLLEIKILGDQEFEYETFKSHSASEIESIKREDAVEQLLKSGLWPHLIQRPFGLIADPEVKPKAIFISGFDSHPLAADSNQLIKGQQQSFQAGINVLRKLTEGTVHLTINSDAEISPVYSNVSGVQINKISGKHPAGNVGVQIHHIDPINKGEAAWTIHPVAVAKIGSFFLDGKVDTTRLVALAGSEVTEPQYYNFNTGGQITKLVDGKLKQEHVRFISGNVLTGERISKDGYLGYYDYTLTVLPEGDHHEFLGWIKPTGAKLSFHRAFGLLSFLSPNKERVLDTNTNGEERAFVQTGSFEEVTPMDIYPTHLIKAVMANDFDEMEELGILEVIEEDLALCEFVDVSKHDIQAILREGITTMLNS